MSAAEMLERWPESVALGPELVPDRGDDIPHDEAISMFDSDRPTDRLLPPTKAVGYIQSQLVPLSPTEMQ